MKTVTVLLRIMLVLVLVCSVLPKAYASDTVPWLTGNFTLTCFAGSCGGGMDRGARPSNLLRMVRWSSLRRPTSHTHIHVSGATTPLMVLGSGIMPEVQ